MSLVKDGRFLGKIEYCGVIAVCCALLQAFGMGLILNCGSLFYVYICDAKGGEVAVAGWCEGSGVAAEELAKQVSELGFRHLVYTDIARDGMQCGIEVSVYERMARAFGHPVVVSGGVANVIDIERLAPVAEFVEGVIAGRAVYEGTLDVAEGVRACAAASRE